MHFENNQQVCHTLNIEAFPVLFRHHILRPSFREPSPLLKHKFYKTCIYLVSNLFSITPMGFFFSLQELAGIVLQKATAVHSRSYIEGVDTTVPPGLEMAGDGAQLLQTIEQTNFGGTAGEEENVRRLVFTVILTVNSQDRITLLTLPSLLFPLQLHLSESLLELLVSLTSTCL